MISKFLIYTVMGIYTSVIFFIIGIIEEDYALLGGIGFLSFIVIVPIHVILLIKRDGWGYRGETYLVKKGYIKKDKR